jgi:hypothetical protein
MQQSDLNVSSPAGHDAGGDGQGVVRPSQEDVLETPPQQTPCPTCGSSTAMPVNILALGQITYRCPSRGVEKEIAQAAGRADTAGKTDREVFHEIISKPENRYLVRQLCWVFSIQGLETYILKPSHSEFHDLLPAATRTAPSPSDIDAVVGKRGPIAPPEMCNGLMVPIVVFDQIYSFSREDLIKSIPRPKKTGTEKFNPAAEEVFDRIMQMTDNAGATDEHRALNYLALRYPSIYANAVEEFARDFSLSGIEVRLSPLSGTRKVVDCIFSYTNRNTDFSEKFSVRVDVTEEFPFLVTKLSPYYDR